MKNPEAAISSRSVGVKSLRTEGGGTGEVNNLFGGGDFARGINTPLHAMAF